jgi:hypothetical protein
VDGHGFARWNALRWAGSRLMRPLLSRSHVGHFAFEDPVWAPTLRLRVAPP